MPFLPPGILMKNWLMMKSSRTYYVCWVSSLLTGDSLFSDSSCSCLRVSVICFELILVSCMFQAFGSIELCLFFFFYQIQDIVILLSIHSGLLFSLHILGALHVCFSTYQGLTLFITFRVMNFIYYFRVFISLCFYFLFLRLNNLDGLIFKMADSSACLRYLLIPFIILFILGCWDFFFKPKCFSVPFYNFYHSVTLPLLFLHDLPVLASGFLAVSHACFFTVASSI